jgi:hypothetical protein
VIAAGYRGVVMENLSAVQSFSDLQSAGGFVIANDGVAATNVKLPSILGWYRILRAHYQWPLFQAIRYALWLAR